MSWLFSAPTISLPFLKEPIRNPLNYVFGDIAKTPEKRAQKKNATQSLYMSAPSLHPTSPTCRVPMPCRVLEFSPGLFVLEIGSPDPGSHCLSLLAAREQLPSSCAAAVSVLHLTPPARHTGRCRWRQTISIHRLCRSTECSTLRRLCPWLLECTRQLPARRGYAALPSSRCDGGIAQAHRQRGTDVALAGVPRALRARLEPEQAGGRRGDGAASRHCTPLFLSSQSVESLRPRPPALVA